MNDLKPCPFCGSAPNVQPWHGGAVSKRRIACVADACHVAPAVTGETPGEAAERWNERAPGPGETATVEPREPVFELRASDRLGAGLVQLWRDLKKEDFEAAIADFAVLCQLDPGWAGGDALDEAERRATEMLHWYATGGDAERLAAALLKGLGIGPVPTGSGVPDDG